MRDEYERARKNLAIDESEFSLVAPHRHREITLKIIEQFTSLRKDGLSSQWLWDSFRNQVWSVHPKDGLSVVADILLPNIRYWFVAEARLTAKKESQFWLYDATGASIVKVISEVHYHEYYIIEKKFSWLLCENHHGIVIACGELKEKQPKYATPT